MLPEKGRRSPPTSKVRLIRDWKSFVCVSHDNHLGEGSVADSNGMYSITSSFREQQSVACSREELSLPRGIRHRLHIEYDHLQIDISFRLPISYLAVFSC